jgi:enoyl-CoA hydratase/carnithine racemase
VPEPRTAATHLLLEMPARRDQPATLRLCRPHAGNSISRQTADELAEAVDELEAAPPAVVVVAADGDRFFCAGGDLDDYRDLTDRASAEAVSVRMRRLLHRLRALPSLVVAAVEGAAVGGGVELALACDLRIAGERATFALSQARLGVIPAWGGQAWLLEAVGRARAVELLMTGRTLTASEAATVRLVDILVPAGSAVEAAAALAAEASRSPLPARRAVKQALAPGIGDDEVTRIFSELWVGEDHRAAERAWWTRPRTTRSAAPGV